jgi:hypothetical protein
MNNELLSFKNTSMKKGLHALFICVMFPFAILGMMHFFGGELSEDETFYVHIGIAVICTFIFLIGVLPQVIKNRTIQISLTKDKIVVFFTDYCDYQLSVQKIKQIKVNTNARQTTMQDYFLVDENEKVYRLPHYYDVPINKFIKLLMQLNPQIERVGEVKY